MKSLMVRRRNSGFDKVTRRQIGSPVDAGFCTMWRVENPTIVKSSLDFSSSGQGRVKVSQLHGDNLVLMNALELMDWDTDRTQLLICEDCGTESCEPGGWVALRIADDRVLLIPAFEEMEQHEWTLTEYAPPHYLKKRGAPYFDRTDYESLVATRKGFPALNDIKPLQMHEAMRLAQMEMPFRMFGEPPELTLADAKLLVVATSDGEPAEHLSTIENILRSNYESREPAVLRERGADEEIIYLFLDAAEFTDWEALVRTEKGERLLLAESFVIEPRA